MKKTKIIIYDDNCPLCAAYTKGFVSAGMIKKENRINFTTIDPALLDLIDTKRCSNEIPVIDSETNQVWYGIEAITEILQTRIPFIKKITGAWPVNWLLNKLYKFISYNRRVIVATKARQGNFDCTPDFNYRYRLVFMAIFLVFNTIMLLPVHTYVLENSFISISLKQLQAVHFLLVGLNIIIACFLIPQHAFEYLGQINMLALVTILLTVPLIFVNKYHLFTNQIFNDAYILLLICFVFKEYYRRLDFAGIIGHYQFIHALNILGITGFIIYLFY